jgi:hypothetical protein
MLEAFPTNREVLAARVATFLNLEQLDEGLKAAAEAVKVSPR